MIKTMTEYAQFVCVIGSGPFSSWL